MDEIITNKEHREMKIDQKVGDNAKALELMMKLVDWKYLSIMYAGILVAFLVSIFLIIVVIEFALSIF